MKCLPASKIPSANGTVLHDCHAEVLAIRAFNHFVLQECKSILTDQAHNSPYVQKTGPGHSHPFTWNESVTLHMYCSEAPCGDASMELVISAQGPDATPWITPLPPHIMERNGLTIAGQSMAAAETPHVPELALLGRACFSHLGVVRRKPARPDAPPSLSKSCADKLALRQCTSLLGSIAALLVSPEHLFLETLVLPESQYSATACERCFSPQGRMGAVKEDASWKEGGYHFRPFAVQTTGLEFAFSRRVEVENATKFVPSNLAVAWTGNGLTEGIIGGVLQGRKQTDAQGGTAVSRRRMWGLAREVAGLAALEERVPSAGTYEDLKKGNMLAQRRAVKEHVLADALRGWVRNSGDEGFRVAD